MIQGLALKNRPAAYLLGLFFGLRLALLRGLGLSCRELSHDCGHAFAKCRNLLPAVRRRVDQLFKLGGKERSSGSPDFAEQRLELREDADVFAAVAIIEELQADSSVVDQRCRHVPVRPCVGDRCAHQTSHH